MCSQIAAAAITGLAVSSAERSNTTFGQMTEHHSSSRARYGLFSHLRETLPSSQDDDIGRTETVFARILKLVVAALMLTGSAIFAIRSPSTSITHVQSNDEPARASHVFDRPGNLAVTR